MNRNHFPINRNKIIVLMILVFLFVASFVFYERFLLLFKDPEGHTHWQYVANASTGILIILLSITAIVLYFSRRKQQKTNLELEAIKENLEYRVEERTHQLNHSEHYLKSILESMPSMLVGLDPIGKVIQWNKKAEKYTGIKMEDALGNDLWSIYPIITVSRAQVKQAMTQKKPMLLRQSQRGLFHFDITIYPLQMNHSSHQSTSLNLGVVLLLDDVSQQVKSENQLIQRDKMSSMGELASSMAHDMNIPLQGMLSDIQKIQEKIIPWSKKIKMSTHNGDSTKINSSLHQSSTTNDSDLKQVIEHLSDTVHLGQQASKIVDNLLNFASAERKEKQAMCMPDVLDHSIELANVILSLPLITFSEITIKKEYDNDLPFVNGYISEIQQVFLSLLRHCFHALSKKKSHTPLIKIRILEGYNSLWIQISHNGIGLTPDEQQSIFEPFFSNELLDSEDDAHKRLSFPHFVITEHHQAHMAVTSDIDVGTTFHIQFQLDNHP
jgi:PAS domain S-box-containing protein